MALNLNGLVVQMAGGDRAALKKLYGATAPKLMGLCMLILDDRSRAEAALKQTFITVWRRAGEYSADKGEALSWLAAVAHREALQLRRTTSTDDTSPRNVDRYLATQAIAALPKTTKLKRSLEKLSPDHANALVTTYLYGLSYGDLANVLNASPAAARDLIESTLVAMEE